jgi:hypothetical protein
MSILYYKPLSFFLFFLSLFLYFSFISIFCLPIEDAHAENFHHVYAWIWLAASALL